MKPKIENQEQFEQVVTTFETQYLNDFLKAKEDAIDLESFYIKTGNDYNNRMNFLQEKYLLAPLQTFINDWRYENNSRANLKTDFQLIEIFCKENHQNLQDMIMASAEMQAIRSS